MPAKTKNVQQNPKNFIYIYEDFFSRCSTYSAFFIFKQEQYLNGMKDALSQSPAGKAIKVSFKSCFYQQQISSLFTIMFQVISAFWKNSLLYKKVLQQNIFNFQLHFFQIFIFIINKFQMNATFRGLFGNRNLPLNISIFFFIFIILLLILL